MSDAHPLVWKNRSMLRWLTAGESHGPELIAILEGLPAGVPITAEDIQADLQRRKDALDALQAAERRAA